MAFPVQPLPVSNDLIPFKIQRSTEEDAGPDAFYVQNGICYSTYSFETGSFINIQGLNETFTWEQNNKLFIEIDIGLNLSVRKAVIKCEPVGTNAPENGWVNYPYFYKIEPQDEFTEGRVTKIRDGKRQLKCYVLIGYLSNDSNKNGIQLEENEETTEDEDPSFIPVQILRENILLINSVVSGVPCAVPFPYFKGGLIHLNSIKNDQKLQEAMEESSNSPSSSTS
jgi:hypothetical protein